MVRKSIRADAILLAMHQPLTHFHIRTVRKTDILTPTNPLFSRHTHTPPHHTITPHHHTSYIPYAIFCTFAHFRRQCYPKSRTALFACPQSLAHAPSLPPILPRLAPHGTTGRDPCSIGEAARRNSSRSRALRLTPAITRLALRSCTWCWASGRAARRS